MICFNYFEDVDDFAYSDYVYYYADSNVFDAFHDFKYVDLCCDFDDFYDFEDWRCMLLIMLRIYCRNLIILTIVTSLKMLMILRS